MRKGQKIAAILFSACFLLTVFFFGISVFVKAPAPLSLSERRELSAFPELTLSALKDGSFFDKTEAFLLDQFPGREAFRRLKAVWQYRVFFEKENNGIVLYDGYAAALTHTVTEKSKEVYYKRIAALCDKLQSEEDLTVYATLIPDKMAYFPDFFPKLDYAFLESGIKNSVSGEYVPISDVLSLDSYYKTDSHWRQEKIVPVANRLLSAMGREQIRVFTFSEITPSFYGVYFGQSALPLPAEPLCLVESDPTKVSSVTRADIRTGEMAKGLLYDKEKVGSNDPYDVFLGGACTVTVIENPACRDEKTLILFSDSYGRSLAPLLLSGYSRIVFYDIRYIDTDDAMAKVPVEKGSDVLIAYSVSTVDVAASLRVQ